MTFKIDWFSGVDRVAGRQKSRANRRRNAGRQLALEQLEQLVMLSTLNEVEPNDTLALATPFSLTQDPAGGNLYTGLGVGSIGTTTDVDYWSFSAHGGDSVTISGDGGSGSNSIYVELRNSSDTIIAQAGDTSAGHPSITNFTIPTDGSYYVKARTNNGSGVTLANYDVRVDLFRGISGEAEPNDSTTNASPIVLAPGATGHASGIAEGNITTYTDVDIFSLGSLRPGDQIDVSLPTSLKPGVSTLNAKVQILSPSGAVVATATGYGLVDGTNHAKYTATASNIYYARVSANAAGSAGNQALYLLQADIQAATTPTVIATSLPTATLANTALTFDGNSQHVSVPDSSSLHASSLTLETWANFSKLDGNVRQILGKQVGTGDSDSYGIWYLNGTLYAGVGDTSGIAQISVGLTPTVGTWYHFALTYDSASGLETLLVNGTPFASTTTNKVIGYDASPFIIGVTHLPFRAN